MVVNPLLAHKSNLFSYSNSIYISLSQHASSGNGGQSPTEQKLVLLWAKSKFYSLIEFLTLKEILCTCSVRVRMPSKAFSTSSASPSSTFYSPCPTLIILVCKGLAILDLLLCSQPPRCSHSTVILKLCHTLFNQSYVSK